MNPGVSPALAGVTGSVDLHSTDSAVDLTDKVHLLPCIVRYNGPCPVSDYFKTNITGVEGDGLKVQEAYFRGRRIQGTAVPLPNGYHGYVLGKKDGVKGKELKGSDEESNDWSSYAEFQNITYWNHDDMPSNDDPIMRCFHWFTIADALHKPVTEEDLSTVSNVKHQS
ncbi:hypothetical protein ZOSMA_175G00030 [Zostera marina]|uniref:Uncharacterized protein n=1 Tax=Zostera marina TaxID=29655 RepID=A0A0K9PU58_ZOSMR|nr:hypothetical protein ZOSMA_175G00030 [Zostera marina]